MSSVKKFGCLVFLTVCFVASCCLSLNFNKDNTALADGDAQAGGPADSLEKWDADLTDDNYASGWADYYNNKDNAEYGTTFENAYKISTARELAIFAKLVRGGNTFLNKYIRLTSDIDLFEKRWLPIGTATVTDTSVSGNAFYGTFDGGDYENGVLRKNFVIRNMLIGDIESSTYGNTRGLFGYIGSTSAGNGAIGKVSNIDLYILSYSLTTSVPVVGGLAGYSTGIIRNISVFRADNSSTPYNKYDAKITNVNTGANSDYLTGGVVGLLRTGEVYNCYNEVPIVSTGRSGGIAGESSRNSGEGITADRSLIIADCVNEASVTGAVIGGISGYMSSSISGSGYIIRSVNRGRLELNRGGSSNKEPMGSTAGGIIALGAESFEIVACMNEGEITTDSKGGIEYSVNLGGIVGGSKLCVIASYNTGTIGLPHSEATVKAVYMGGIVGQYLAIFDPVKNGKVFPSFYVAQDGISAAGGLKDGGAAYANLNNIFYEKPADEFDDGSAAFYVDFTITSNNTTYTSDMWENLKVFDEQCWRFLDGNMPLTATQNIKFSVITPTATYTGENIVPEVKVIDSKGNGLSGEQLSTLTASYYYKAKSADSYTPMTGAPVNKGLYKVVYAVNSEDYYGSTQKEYEIISRVVTVTPDAVSSVYGDADAALTYTFDKQVITNGVDNGKGIVARDLTDGKTTVFSGSPGRTAGADVGEYNIVKSTLSVSSNYTIVFTEGVKYTVTARPLSVTLKDITAVYGDTSIQITNYTKSNIVGNDDVRLTDIYYSVRVTGTSQNVTKYEVGTAYTLKITAAGISNANYTIDVNTINDCSLTITPAQLKLNVQPASKQYGDTEVSFVHTVSNWKYNDAASASSILTAVQFSSQGTDMYAEVGKYDITAEATLNSGNYTLTIVKGSLTVTKRIIYFNTVTAVDKYYDGNTTAVVNVVFTNALPDDADELNEKINAYLRANPTLAQFASAAAGDNISVTIKSFSLSNIFINYEVEGNASQQSATASILKRPIRVEVQSKTVQYGSTEVYTPVFTLVNVPSIEADSIKNTLEAALMLNNSVTETTPVGVYPITRNTIDFEQLFPNYTASEEGWITDGAVTVIKRKLNVNKSLFSVTGKTYDGTKEAELSYGANYITWGNIPQSNRFEPVIFAEYVSAAAGTKSVKVTFTIPDEFTNRYEIEDFYIDAAAAIAKRTVTLKFKNMPYSVVYGQNIPVVSFTLEGAVTADLQMLMEALQDCLDLGGAKDGVNAGKYYITFTNEYLLQTADYAISIPSAYIEVTPVELPSVVMPNKSWEYDGAEHLPEATMDGVALETYIKNNPHLGLVVNYTGEEAFKNVREGGYSITLIVTLGSAAHGNYIFKDGGNNKSFYTAKAVYTVNKRPLTVRAISYKIVLGEDLPAYSATFEGFVDGESENDSGVMKNLKSLTFACIANSNSPIGSYVIDVSGDLESTNYSITYASGMLVIEANSENASKNGVIVKGMESGVEFSAEAYTSDTQEAAPVKTAVTQKFGDRLVAVVYVVSLTKNGKEFKSSNSATFKLFIPKEQQNQEGLMVYKYGDDGSLTFISSSVAGKFLEFYSNEGGTFVIVAPENDKGDDSVMTYIFIGIGGLAVVTAVIVAVSLSAKRKRKKSPNGVVVKDYSKKADSPDKKTENKKGGKSVKGSDAPKPPKIKF